MRSTGLAILIALLAVAIVAAAHAVGVLERLELVSLDARYATGLGRKPPGNDVVVAWIDQESMDFMAGEGVPFPWPREVYAQVLEHLASQGARAVVFDILFDQRGHAEDDRAFGAALTKFPRDALAMKFVTHRGGGGAEDETRSFAARGTEVAAPSAQPPEHGFVLPIPELARGAEHLGFVNIRADADGTFRRYDLHRTWRAPDGRLLSYPSLALAAYRLAAEKPGADAPLDAEGRMLLSLRGPAFTFDRVKLVNVLASINRIDANEPPLYGPERFRDKVVLVGIHAEGYEDAHPTPLDAHLPGVELHATALDNLLRGDALRDLEWDLPLAALGALLAAAAVFSSGGVLRPALALLVLLGVFATAVAQAWTMSVAVPVAAPMLAGGSAASLSFLYRLVVEGRQRREMHRAFRSYLAPEVLAEVLRDPAALRLGGELREVTLLFTDLQGFTGISERSRPDELVAFLNDYFTRMCRPLLAERGVIDKFVGDAIMAIFGAPLPSDDHGRAAVRAAVAALRVSETIAAQARARGIDGLATRIGIHTGPAVIGNMGSAERFDYTAIGDTVNLAARLEGANKAFGTRCLVSEATWATASHDVLGREVGGITVVGRAAPIRVFEPIALAATATDAERAFAGAWHAAMQSLRSAPAAEARAAFAACETLRPHDALARLYGDKLAAGAFDGVFHLDHK